MVPGSLILNCRKRCSSAIQRFIARRMNLVPLVTILILSAIIYSRALAAQTNPGSEYQVEAAFLYNFARFVEWPQNAFSGPRQPLGVCVFGHDPFGPALEDSLLGKSIGKHPLMVGHANQLQDLTGCQVVFVGGFERARIPDLIHHLQGRPVLLVGESEGFAESGGTIQFTIEDHHVHFLINPDAAERAGLKVSSKLLALAKIVRDPNKLAEGSALR